MENRLSDLARGASSSQGSGDRKGKKNRAPSPVLVIEGQGVAGTRSAWTGEKKTKIQSAPSSGDLGGAEQIEGLDWDEDYLEKEIGCCLERLREVLPYDPDVYYPFDEQQLEALNERLALYRIRAYEGDCRELDGASLTDKYPASKLEQNGYYEHYEPYFEWYFDPEYCEYADLQDYQRLVLRENNGEYEDWEKYRKICSKLEGDQQFVQLWDELSSKTKLIELYLSNRSGKDPRIESLVFYHALKIAEGLPHVSKTLVCSTFQDFLWHVRFEHTWYKCYADFYFEMWQLITKQKMNLTEALRRIHKEGKYRCCTFVWEAQFEKKRTESIYTGTVKSYLDRIGATAKDDEAYQLIMKFVVEEIVMKPRTYYDYAKKKLHIAKEIGLIAK